MRHLNTISQFLFICFIPELPDVTAKLIVCVAYNAIRLSDIQRSQLYSSAKVLSIKNVPKEKNQLVHSVAQALLLGIHESFGQPQELFKR